MDLLLKLRGASAEEKKRGVDVAWQLTGVILNLCDERSNVGSIADFNA